MHSLAPGRAAHWTMQDQAELTDVLTTHPYPYFTPHCDQDPANTIRTILHSTAESRFYADIGGKPCLVEEIGTLGPILASENVAADFVRTCLFSLWAHDCLGLLWWCAYDQLHLGQAPYDWAACERELGLFRIDRTGKPVLHELSRFSSWMTKLSGTSLEPRLIDSVCILTEGQDQWAAAYSSFILAKQAGFDLEFQFTDQPLKPARIYLVPSVKGMSSMSRRFWLELLNAVKEGAVLYLSHDDCLLSPFNEVFGIEIQTRQRRSGKAQFKINANHSQFSIASDIRLNLNPKEAIVLAQEEDGNPVLTCNPYGRGQVFFLSLPLENALANTPGCFHQPDMPPFWQIYHLVAGDSLPDRVVIKNHPMLGVTEHKKSENVRTVVLINYSPVRIKSSIYLISDWHLSESIYGCIVEENDGLEVDLPGNDAVVMVVSKK
jgi:hypothetical protein